MRNHFLRGGLATVFALSVVAARADVFFSTDAASTTGITRISAGGVKTTVNTPGIVQPVQAAFDSAGNIYVLSGAATSQVLRFPRGGGAGTPVGDAQSATHSIVLDENDVPYVSVPSAQATPARIRKLAGQAFTDFATLPDGSNPAGMAFSPGGDLFVADAMGNRVFKVTANGSVSTFSSDVSSPYGVAFDPSGKLHVTDTQEGGRIATFAGSGNGNNTNNNSRKVVSGLGAVGGLAFDRTGVAHFLVAGGELRKVNGNGSAPVASGLGTTGHLASSAAIRKVVAFKGQSVLAPNGATFAKLGSPAIGGGNVVFRGTLLAGVAGVAASNAEGIWQADESGAVALLARKNFPPPGLPDDVLTLFGDPIVNSEGNVAFLGTLRAKTGTTVTRNAKAVFTNVTGSLAPVLRSDSQAPGMETDVKFTAFRQLVLDNSSGPTVLATVAGPGITAANNLGLWAADTAGAFTHLIRTGDTITVSGAAKKLKSMSIFAPTPFSTGQARHTAGSRGFTLLGRFTDGSTAVLFVQPGNTPVVLTAKGGSAGPDLPGAKFATFGSPCVADPGADFAFSAKLTPLLGGVTAANAGTIFNHDTVEPSLLAQKTFAAPGVQGAFFATISDPVTSPAGATAFLGKMKAGLGGVLASTSAGIWASSGADTSPALAVRQGSPSSGVPGTVKFVSFKQFVMPAAGGPIFTATIAGTDITAANNFGVWANDGAGTNELLLRKGDKIDINGKTRTITAINLFKTVLGVTGQSRHFDAAGNVVCHVVCSDATQAILTFSRP